MVVQIKGVSQGSARFLSRTSLGKTTPSDSWYAKLDTTTTDVGNGVAIDSSGNVYVVGFTNTDTDVIVLKYNNNGSLVWQRKLSGASSTESGNGIAVDNLGNVYIVGYTDNALTADILIAKYNTSGTLLWQTILASTGGDYGYGIVVDSSGNVYVTGTAFGTNNDMITAKYDTNGNLTWQRTLTGTEGFDSGIGIALDSFGNVYIVGIYSKSGNFTPIIVKYDNSGSLLWQRQLSIGSSFNTNGPEKIAVDSSGNVYIVFSRYIVGSGAYDVIIAKYDTSGTFKWQRKFGNFADGRDEFGNGIAVDSSGSVYITGSTYNGTNDDIIIAKYDTLGTIQWQRTLASSGTDRGNAIAVDSSGTNVYITGSIDSDILIAKLPGDGSIVNPTYTGKLKLIHSISTLSDGAGDFSPSTPSPLLTDAAGTLNSFKCDLYSNDPGLTHSLTYNKPIQVQLLNGGGAQDRASKIAVDSSGNYYVTGENGFRKIATIKFNSSGIIQWQRTLYNSSGSIGAYAMTVDSSGNVYIVGDSDTGIYSYPLIIKYSPSGTVLWKFNVDTFGGTSGSSYGVVVDSSGNVYVVGRIGSDMIIVKYNSSGGSVWQRKLVGSYIVDGIAVDSSGTNVYITSRIGGGNYSDILISKYDTDGNNIWQRKLATSSDSSDIGYGIAVDPSNNVYVVCNQRDNYAYIVTVKYDSLGNIQWQRKLAGTTDDLYKFDIVVDSSGNSYISGRIPMNYEINTIVAKYDTNGNIQWQRKLSGALVSAIAIDSSGTYAYIAGFASNGSNNDMLIAKIYINGGTTGTYGLFTYSVSTLAEAAGTLVPSTPDPLFASQSLSRTHLIPSFTEAEGGLTRSYQGLVADKDVWTSTFGASGSSLESANGIALDSAKNIYTIGKTLHTSGTTDSLLVKYNNSGTIQWQRTLTGSNSNDSGNGIAIDSFDNIYTVGTTGSNANDIVISKYNTSGVIQWQAILGTSTAQTGNGIAVDSSGNVYITSTTINGTDYDIITAKYNSSGTIQWQRQLGIIGSNKNDQGFGIAADSSGNVYITGYGNNTANFTTDILIVKYDTNGNINNGWQRRLTGGVDGSDGREIVVDSSGNVYIVGLSYTTSYSLTIAKYNSSGTIQWQRTLGGAYSDVGIGIAVDSSDNVYVTGWTGTGSYDTSAIDIIIAKYYPSGDIVWQRILRSSDATSDQGNAIKVDGDYVYIAGTSAGAKSLIAKLPNDGSYTGTYGGFTYAISTLGESAGTLTPSTPSPLLTDAAGTLTSSLILSSTELNASSVNNYLR